MAEATTEIPGTPGAGAPRGETIKLSLAAGMCWAVAMLGLSDRRNWAVVDNRSRPQGPENTTGSAWPTFRTLRERRNFNERFGSRRSVRV